MVTIRHSERPGGYNKDVKDRLRIGYNYIPTSDLIANNEVCRTKLNRTEAQQQRKPLFD